MDRKFLILLAILLFAFMCKWTPLAGGEAEVVTDNTNSNTITGTDLAFLQSDESSSDTNLNNNKDILNALDETLESAAESTLNDLFNTVDENKGVAQTQDMPDPISYPQQSANQLTQSELTAPEVAAPEVAAPEVIAPQVAAPEVVAPQVVEPISVLGYDSLDNMFSLDQKTVSSNDKLNPPDLLPKGIDMTNKNFLTSTITDTKNRVGENTQLNRNRKNYDLRSTPVIEKKQVSPWNISTDDPDTTRRQFEIGSSDCPPCPASQDNNVMPVAAR